MSHCNPMATDRAGRRLPLTAPPSDGADLLAAARVMELCRNNSALSVRVFHLRHDPTTLQPSWTEVLAIIERKPR